MSFPELLRQRLLTHKLGMRRLRFLAFPKNPSENFVNFIHEQPLTGAKPGELCEKRGFKEFAVFKMENFATELS